MKKLLLIASVVALTAASCNQASQPNNQNQNPTPTPNPSTAPTTQTYSNATYGFSFQYPANMTFVSPTYANLSDKVTQAQISIDQYPGTNFGDAAIAVSTQSAKTLTECLKLSAPENGDGFKSKVTINGVDFYMTKTSGAGAGNLYESTIYRTFRNSGTCLEINETIHTSNIGNFPSGTVAEVNKTDVHTKLDAVLQSFKFTK